MITHEICNLFESGGACIDAKYNNKNINKLNYNKIVSIFEQKGVILFKNYSILKYSLS